VTELSTLVGHEAGHVSTPPPGRLTRRTRSRGARRWAAAWLLALGWSLWSFLDTGAPVLNPDGLPALGEFWRHALHPDLSPELLRATATATVTTVAFAVLGTVLAVVIGLVLAVPLSQTWWARAGRSRVPGTVGLLATRAAVGLPRGVHEAVWGVFLVAVLGGDPVVGVLAIAIPFGAMTAKVYAEIVDEADHGPYELLRQAGAGRVVALAYGVLPGALPALTSYAFYRFECSIRSAVILGMVGVGGLGLQLTLAFQGLQYAQMWTSIYALVLLAAAVDRWGALLRSGRGARRWVVSALGISALVVGSAWHLAPDVTRWFSPRTADLLGALGATMLPLRLPEGGWAELVARSVDTVQMSVVALTLATVAGTAMAFLAARGADRGWLRVLGWPSRMLLLLTRAIPPPVWALLVLFVVFPGPLPGALALGIYTFGILGRLFAEVVEELDPSPRQALQQLGAPAIASFGYATLPAAAGPFVAYSLYRWEVAARETVVVGVVGAGGLGRLLEQQRAAFDVGGMTATVLALVVVSLLVDAVSVAVRRSLR
jgi:phosphonate transport system permease protein